MTGLADSLRSEVLLYQKSHDLKIHLYTPAGILSPGYEEEEKTKPAVTKKIEEGDEPISPEKCVEVLLSGESRSESLARKMSLGKKGVV
jgi:3-dehydrosphinganine reductase